MKKKILWGGFLILFACLTAGLVLSLRRMPEPQSLYISMSDGTGIAVDVWLPADLKAGEKIPAVMRSTCYWRSYELTPAGEWIRRLGLAPGDMREGPAWTEAGYALVLVDVRGSGASYGRWEMTWSEREIADLGEILDWIIAQPWSNGSAGAYGVSYDGNLAEMMAALRHPALKAVAPQYSDFDLYNGLVRPGGVYNQGFMTAWNEFHGGLVRNDICALEAASGVDCEQMQTLMTGVRPVDEDVDGARLSEAVSGHARVDVHQVGKAIEFSDDTWGTTGLTLGDLSPYTRQPEIESSGVPMYVWAGWLDSATADGALSRFMTFSNPQKVLIGPWSHGGGQHTDPFLPADTVVTPSPEEQFQMLVEFFDLHLKDSGNAGLDTGITYYTMGAGTWTTTRSWPPAGFTNQTWYFNENGALTPQVPEDDSGADEYRVNPDASTGEFSRWHTGLFMSDVIYPDRQAADGMLLTYTSAPLPTDVEITGNPVVTLRVASDTTDPAFHVYLEDVAPDGRVTYITEGILRGVHHPISEETPPYAVFGPHHTMERAAAVWMVPGEVTEIRFTLFATSVLIEQGHQIRVAVAGQDGSTFEAYPAAGSPLFTIQRNRASPSFILLPMQAK